jgi:metal-sulfur cluster biosynthetic enzyme
MVDEEKVLKKLKEVVDPELGVDIVGMGLIYTVIVNSNCNRGRRRGCKVKIKMTLTSPGCPLAPIIHKEVEEAVMKIRGVQEVKLQLVWDPPWTPSRASEEVRVMFGW